MAEAIFHAVQLGREATFGTAVAATTVFGVDTGFTGAELDRASESPEEDFGSPSREWTGRGSTGVRAATASVPFTCRFQDVFHAFEMHWDTVSPTGAGPYVYTYKPDQVSNLLSAAVKGYTVQYGDIASTQDEWRMVGTVATDLEMGFDALSAPGNSMWKGTLGLLALNREASAMTAAQTPPATLETMEGHLTLLSEGGTGTAFASLSELAASLKSFSFRSSQNAQIRAYGGASDVGVSIGRSAKGNVEFDAMVGIGSTAKTDLHDIYTVAGSVPTERRWRITIDGSGNNVATLDFRCRFTATDVGEHEGERLYAVNGVFVYDATLASHAAFTLTNDVSAIP